MIVGDIIRKIGKAVRRIFSKKATIETAFDTKIAVSGKMENAIHLWAEMYENRPPWLSDNAEEGTVETLGVPASIASEIARLPDRRWQTILINN